MTEVQLRPATPDDSPALLHLIRELARYERVDPDTTVLATAESLRSQLASDTPPFGCIVALRDGAVVGLALYFFNFSTWTGRRGIYLEDLFVLPEHRGLGLGKALLQRIAQEACEQGCARVDWAVLDWNQPARDFYESLGAQCLDEWRIHRLTGETLEKFGAPTTTR